MGSNRLKYNNQGPAPSAQHFEDQRERMKIHQDWQERENAELAEYAAAMRSGNEARAIEIALTRYNRSRQHFLKQYEQPMSIAESEIKRGRADQGTDSDLSPEPLVGPALVRVPPEVSGTQFPCFVDAADGPVMTDPYTGESVGHGIPVKDAPIQDGYLATVPPPLGGAKAVSYLVYDEKGIVALTSTKKLENDTADDIRRADQKRLYAKREQTLREWGYLPGIDTDQLKRNGQDPE